MDEIYKPPTTTRLVTNYAAGFSRLGFRAMQTPPIDADEAVRLYNIALKFAPSYGPALNGLIAIYAVHMMQPEKALPLAEKLLEAQPERVETWVRYGGIHLMIGERVTDEATALGHFEEAVRAYEHALSQEPERRELYAPLMTMYQRLGRTRELNSLMDLWGRYAPEELEALMESAGEEGLTP
jgi:tetratricopeptide (TPR) repeat protein